MTDAEQSWNIVSASYEVLLVLTCSCCVYSGPSSTQLSPATGVPRHPLSHQSHPHPFPPPIFAPPVASAPSAAVTANAPPQQSNPHPFSAESLFQSSMSLQHGDLYKGIFLFFISFFLFFIWNNHFFL